MTDTATAPEPATDRPMELMEESSTADSSTSAPVVTTAPSVMEASTWFTMTLPKPVTFTATAPEAPTPTVAAMIRAFESDARTTSPAVAVTVAFAMEETTVLVMTLPVKAPLTATAPEPATLILIARMLASRSMGESSRDSLMLSISSADTIHSGMALGAISDASRVTSSAAVTVALVMVADTVLVMTLPMAVTCTATVPEPDTPMAMARIMASDSAVRPTEPPASTVAPSTEARMLLAITLADRATPTATVPDPATPMPMASMLEVSSAVTDREPPAFTTDATVTPSTRSPSSSKVRSLMEASVRLATTLAARLT